VWAGDANEISSVQKRTAIVALAAIAAGVVIVLVGAIKAGGTRRPSFLEPRSDAGIRGEDELGSDPAQPIDRAPVSAKPAVARATDSGSSELPRSSPGSKVHVHGRVLGLAGEPKPAIGVAVSNDAPCAWTAVDGSFDATVRLGACLFARSDSVATLLEHCVGSEGEKDAIIVVAPAVDIAGSVIDARGEAVSGARVWLRMESRAVAGVPAVLDNSSVDVRWTTSDASGRFELKGIPTGTGITLQVRHAERGAAELPVPEQSTESLVIRLEPSSAATRELAGIVVYPDGSAAPESIVCLGENNRTRTTATGRFRLPVREDFEGASLVAYHTDYQPAVLPAFGARIDAADTSDLRLVLGEKTLTISGRVEDAQQRPLGGWVVAIASGVETTLHKLPPVFVEQLIDAHHAQSQTDASGDFTIGGLRDAEYVIRAWDPKSLVIVEVEHVAAGTRDLRVRVPADAAWPMLRGRVIARDGTPLSGVQLLLQVGCKVTTGLWTLTGESTLTDSLGNFSLENVPRRHAFLMCQGEAICTESCAVPPDCDPLHFQITLSRKSPFRVKIVSGIAKDADSIGVATESGAPGFITKAGGYGGTHVSLAGLGDQLLTTSEDVRAFVVYKSDSETKRVSVRLDPNAITIVEL
jgi:hypothetical protein